MDVTGLHGVIPPLVTPLTPDHQIDVSALERVTCVLLEAGVHGLFVLGSSGEAPYLTDTQRERVVEVVRAVNARAVPLLVGAVAPAGARTVASALAAERWGADAVVVTPPFFGLAATAGDVTAHYSRIAAALTVPVIMYHIPSRTGSAVPPAVIASLAEAGTIAAVKDSGPDFGAFRQLLLATEQVPGFGAFTGSEVLVDAALLAGAVGVMPGLANLDPHGFVRLYEAARRGDWATAVTEQARLARLLQVVAHGPAGAGPDGRALSVFKTAMQMQGVIGSAATLATDQPLSPAGRQLLRDQLRAADLL